MRRDLPGPLRALLRLFPDDFRRLHEAGLIGDYAGPRDVASRLGRAWYWARAVGDLTLALLGVWWDRSIMGSRSAGRGRSVTRGSTVDNLISDVRYALRGLRRTPGFTTMAVGTIALGLGANTAIFSVVNGVLIEPLPFEDSSELTRVWSRFLPESGFDFPYFSIDPTEYLDLRDSNRSFDQVAAYTQSAVTLTGDGDDAEQRNGLRTTWNLFRLLGIEAQLGRTLVAEDDLADGPNVVVLSHALWETRFGADPAVVGSVITLDRLPYQVIGVLPPGVAFPNPRVDAYTPLQLGQNPSNRQAHYLAVVGRLGDGVTLQAAQAETERLMAQWAQDYPDIHTGHFLFLEGFKDAMVSGVRPALLLLLGAVAFVLLVVCVNVANLLLVRGHARSGEVAVRRALGASRWRIVQVGLVESAVLASVGAVLGLGLARYGVRALLALDDGALPSAASVEVDATVLGFTALLAIVTTLSFGLAPAIQGLGQATAGTLREQGRTGTGSRRRVTLRSVLVAAEVALSFMLVIGAGLMTRSFTKLLAEDPGFDAHAALVANYSLPASAYPEPGDGIALLEEVVTEAEASPGVNAVTHVAHLPMLRGQAVLDFSLEGLPEPGPGQPTWNAGATAVRANYFEVMGIDVLRGRAFDPALDRVDGVPAVVVSRGVADRFLAGRDPIGQRMRLSGSGEGQPWWTIVGVVEDVQYARLGVDGSPMYYLLTSQIPLYNTLRGFERFGTFVVRPTAEDPLDVAETFRRIVARSDSELPLTGVATLESVVGDSVAQTRFVTTLMGAFAALALLLGAVGIYGVTSFVVSQRRQEIGIRAALGAAGRDLASLVIRQGVKPVAAGMALGAIGATSVGRLLSSLLYGVEPSDAVTYASVLGVLSVVAVAALWLPARRAARLDPVSSLRND